MRARRHHAFGLLAGVLISTSCWLTSPSWASAQDLPQLVFATHHSLALNESSGLDTAWWMGGLALVLIVGFLVSYLKRRYHVLQASRRAVDQENHRLVWALEQAAGGVFDWDLDRHRVFVSARLMQLLGQEARDAELDTPTFRQLLGPLYERFLPLLPSSHDHAGALDVVVELKGHEGLRLQAQYFPCPRGRGHVLGMAVDVSHELRLGHHAEALSKLAKSLAQQTLAAEAASRSKARFLADMSHELRTPLNAIIGFADVMGREMFGSLGSPRYQDYCHDIQTSGRHLLSYIDAILEAARREGEDGLPCNAPVPLVQLFEQSLAGSLTKKQKQKSVQITADVQSGLVVYGDACALREMVDHMLEFALEHVAHGERLSLRVRPLDHGLGLALLGPSSMTDCCCHQPDAHLLAARALAEWQGGRLKTMLFGQNVGVVYARLPLRAIEPNKANLQDIKPLVAGLYTHGSSWNPHGSGTRLEPSHVVFSTPSS